MLAPWADTRANPLSKIMELASLGLKIDKRGLFFPTFSSKHYKIVISLELYKRGVENP